jgi:alpha-L-fucosidase
LLNIVQTPEGDLEDDVLRILKDITAWMEVNNVSIYDTRPWKVHGEGPSVSAPELDENGRVKDFRNYQQSDLRFTSKNNTLYTFCMEKPTNDIHIRSLGLKTQTGSKVSSIKLLGSDEKIKYTQDDDEVIITKPAQLPDTYKTIVFVIELE